MIVYKSQYSTADYNKEDHLFETIWTEESFNLGMEGAKKEFLLILDAIAKTKPRFVLADTSKFLLDVDAEFQSWIVLKFISEIIELGVLKYSIIVSQDRFNKVADELMTDLPDDDLEIQYFTNKEQAIQWMLDINHS